MTVFSYRHRTPALLLTTALLLVACGGGESSETPIGESQAQAEAQGQAQAQVEPAPTASDKQGETQGQVEAPTAPPTREQAATTVEAEPRSTAVAPRVEAEGGATADATTTTESAFPQAAAARLAGATLFNDGLPAAGHPGGSAVPLEARIEDISNPTTVVGRGTAASCTSAAFVRAVARGGVITFNCGRAPVTIVLTATAKIVNNAAPKTVIDGGGKVTLSGGGQRRILYMNTCDPDQVWTTPTCQNQDHPRLTLQNLTFVDGLASGTGVEETYGGGAVFVRGGRLKIVNSRFFRNQCDTNGPDVGGAAVRALDQFNDLPLYVVNSTFGGRSDLANVCSNGGALSSIGVSFRVINTLITHNRAIGYGANPARPNTPGGGSGGAIYNDGNTFHLRVLGSKIEQNTAREGGGAIFFVSNDLTGTLRITNSILRSNPSAGFETAGFPGIFYLGSGPPLVTESTLVH